MKRERAQASPPPFMAASQRAGAVNFHTLTSLLTSPRLPYPLLFSWGQNVQKSTQQGVTPAQ